MRRLQRVLAGCRYVSCQLWAIALVLPMMQPAWGNEFHSIKQAQRGFSTNAADLLAQGNVAVTEVTGVKVNATSTGIEVILQTSKAEALQILNKSDANSFIADIPNAQLRLPLGNSFQQEKPFAGIAELTVINQDANTIRITVKGEGGIPKVELFNSDEGLIFGLTPTTTTSQKPQTQPQTAVGVELGVILHRRSPGRLREYFTLPSYLLTEAAIFYKQDRFRAAINFKNLFDVDYFDSALSRQNIFYGEPFTVQGTISWEF